jgi:predicted NAD-dependent protein-ADP-ribosyltransferase YbiA (DUF1768 family)
MTPNPRNDGIDHINVYSKGKTRLGQLLSNFAPTPFECEDGRFNSVEGYWYWLLCDHEDKDKLRTTYGFNAKKLGRELGATDWPENYDQGEFRQKIYKAMYAKAKAHPEIQDLLKENNLAFYHYYVYGDRVVMVKGCGWIMDDWQSIQYDLKNGIERG